MKTEIDLIIDLLRVSTKLLNKLDSNDEDLHYWLDEAKDTLRLTIENLDDAKRKV